MLFPRHRNYLPLPLLALGLLLNLPPALRADTEEEKPDARVARVAHIKLTGVLEEHSPNVDPLLGLLGETFKAKIDRIHKAREDKEVRALFLEVYDLEAGYAKIDELTQALARFRKAGKKVYAYLESAAMRDYLLALACDDVGLPDEGWLLLTGIRLEATFYKDLLDKLGVKADMLQMGDFKGAAEPLTRTRFSEACRRQLESVLDDRFEHGLVGRIVEGRPGQKFTAEKVKKLIDGGPFTARRAVKEGLADRVTYPDQYADVFKKDLGVDEVKVVRDYGKKKEEDIDVFTLYRKLLFGPLKIGGSRNPKVAVIYASGAITTGKGGSGLMGGEVIGSETFVKAIRQAEEDKTVKAIVLRVDSPGGSALASDLIWHELKRCKKPVVASMSDVAASGGYYISMAARKIYAEPGTLTGSIGVVGGKIVLGGLYEKIGIHTEILERGANSGLLSSTTQFSPSQRTAFKAMMEDVYDQFLAKALEGRRKAGKKMDRADLEKLAGGRVWTGRQAKENGLIDELGSLEDAIAAAWKMADMPADKEPDLLQLPKSKGFLDNLLDSKIDSSLSALLPLLKRDPALKARLRQAEGLLQLRGEPVWLVLPYHLELR